MASPTTALLLSLIAGVLAISATARPCKTIFFISSSSSSSSYHPTADHHLPNPNSPPRLTFFITQFHHTTTSFFSDRTVKSSLSNDFPQFPNPHRSSPSSSSFRDRTMDIVSIVGALLFGAGCGALTAATMYFVWSLFFSDRRLDFASDEDEDEYYDVEDDVKKNGYAAVPNAEKEVPPSADEVEAMK